MVNVSGRVGVGLRVLTNVFLHICELSKYIHIGAHLHEPYVCKEGFKQNAALFNIIIVGGRLCLIMQNSADAQIVSADLSPPTDLFSSRFHKSQRKYKNGVCFYSKHSFLLPLSRLNAVEMIHNGV